MEILKLFTSLLCSVIYKFISKVLTNRLRPFLDALINHWQNNFIMGKIMKDNSIVAKLFTICICLIIKWGTLIFKVDIEKDCDMMDWTFLKQALRLFGFQ
uniref:Reverse transcriptase domain-containing protein n=1 Tax=Cajanus cajan TaxID=3821 RepID=A0A151U7Y4_CAJCA|nr:hypothetical protein KK1_008137 [Cajanus cajan]